MNFSEFKKRYQKIPVGHYSDIIKKDPVVSVCVQTYQHADYIRECVDGILIQKTSFPFEIIIGEDGSDDGTREICLEYARKYPGKIRLLLHKRENKIKVAGRETGRFNFHYNIYSARGKYIALCEGDDFWTDPYKLQKQLELMEKHPDYSACFHAVRVVDAKTKKTVKFFKQANQDKVFSKNEWYELTSMQTSLFFQSKHVFSLPDWFINAPIGGVPLTLFLSQQGKFAYINQIMSSYRLFVPGSFTVTVTLKPSDDYEISKKMVKMYDGFDKYTKFRYSEIIAIKQLLHLSKELKVNPKLGKLGFLKQNKIKFDSLSLKRKIAFCITLFFPRIYTKINSSITLRVIRKFILESR